MEKSLDEVPEGAALGDQTNRVFSGSFATYGRATFEVTQIGMGTEVGKIASLLKSTSEKRTPLQINLDDFGRKLSIIILVFCGILFGINVIQGGSVVDAFLFAVALAVAAIPEALSSIVTIACFPSVLRRWPENTPSSASFRQWKAWEACLLSVRCIRRER